MDLSLRFPFCPECFDLPGLLLAHEFRLWPEQSFPVGFNLVLYRAILRLDLLPVVDSQELWKTLPN